MYNNQMTNSWNQMNNSQSYINQNPNQQIYQGNTPFCPNNFNQPNNFQPPMNMQNSQNFGNNNQNMYQSCPNVSC